MIKQNRAISVARPGARVAWLGGGGGGINNFLGGTKTLSRVKTKKTKVFIAKHVRNCTDSGVETKKKRSLLRNLRKSGSCPLSLGWWPVFWGSQASNYTSVAPSLLLSLGHNPRSGGTIIVWGGTSSDSGKARLRNAPPRRQAWVSLWNANKGKQVKKHTKS